MRNFKLHLVAIDFELYQAFLDHFSKFPNVKVHNCGFEEIEEFDCLVSPANSFGIMDGGMDKIIIDFFGIELQNRVQRHILEFFSGEQPIGTSFIVETENSFHPFLAHVPTMRLPEPIKGTTNPYYAMKAMLESVLLFNEINSSEIESVVCPGLGTGTGEMKPDCAARQMALAYEHFINPPSSISAEFAFFRDLQIKNTSK